MFSLSDFFSSPFNLTAGNGNVTASGGGLQLDVTPSGVNIFAPGARSSQGGFVVNNGDVSFPGFSLTSGSGGTQIDFLGTILTSGTNGFFVNGSKIGATSQGEVSNFSSIFSSDSLSLKPDGTGTVNAFGGTLNFGPSGSIDFGGAGTISYGSGPTVIDLPFFQGVFG